MYLIPFTFALKILIKNTFISLQQTRRDMIGLLKSKVCSYHIMSFLMSHQPKLHAIKIAKCYVPYF